MRCANEDCGPNTIVGEISESGAPVRKCCKCGARWAPYVATTAPEALPVAGKPSAKLAVKVAPQPVKPAAKFDVLKAARARLRELNTEIARLQKLTVERDQLARLLDAAKTPNGSKAAIPLRRCAT